MEAQKFVKVRALVATYQGERYYRADDVLLVKDSDADAQVFGRPIFERVDPSTPEKITSSGEALAQEREATLAGRTQPGQAAAPDAPTGAADVLSGGDAKADGGGKKK